MHITNLRLSLLFEQVTNAAYARYLTVGFMGEHELERLLDAHPLVTSGNLIRGEFDFHKHPAAFKTPKGWQLADVYITEALLGANLWKELYGTQYKSMMADALVSYMAAISNPMLEYDLKKRMVIAKRDAIKHRTPRSTLAERVTFIFMKSLWDDMSWLHRAAIDQHLELLRKKRKRLFHPVYRWINYKLDQIRLSSGRAQIAHERKVEELEKSL